jgi:hypothetical protein
MAKSTAKLILAKQFSIRELLIILFLCAVATMVVTLQYQLQIERAKNQLLQTRLDWRVPGAAYLRLDDRFPRQINTSYKVGSNVDINGRIYLVNFGKPLRCRAELIEMSTGSVISETEFEAVPFRSEKFELGFTATLPGTPNMQPGRYLVSVSLLGDGQQEQANGTKIIEFTP